MPNSAVQDAVHSGGARSRIAGVMWAYTSAVVEKFEWPNPYAPSIVRLEMRNKKRNRGRKLPPQFLTFEFYQRHDGTLERIEAIDGGTGRSVADLAADSLTRGPTARRRGFRPLACR